MKPEDRGEGCLRQAALTSMELKRGQTVVFIVQMQNEHSYNPFQFFDFPSIFPPVYFQTANYIFGHFPPLGLIWLYVLVLSLFLSLSRKKIAICVCVLIA